jgi:hypothetical protein
MRRQGFFWLKNWGFFAEPDRYVKKLLVTLGQDDKVVSDEVVRTLRRERLRVALLYLTWWANYGWGRLAKWKSTIKQQPPPQQEPDPAAGGSSDLTKGKKGRSE